MQQRRKRKAGYAGSLLAGLFALALMLAFVLPLNVCAGNLTSGTLGDNDGIEWTYDAETKTLTVTGEDSGLEGNGDSPFVTISSDVEKIVMKDCTLHESACELFANLSCLKEVEFDDFDTSNVTDMWLMFWNCSSLKSLDLSSFDTSNVTDMENMFYGCSSLTSLNLSSFDMSNVNRRYSDIAEMLRWCNSLETIYTPKKMLENQEIQLPNTFYDEDANSTTYITATFCNKKLTKTEPVAVDPVVEFVTRMYQQCLSRDPDQSGLDGWVGQLRGGYMNGADIAEQFVFSAEMLSKNLSDEEFVDVLYRAMMGREADADGRTGWVSQLSNGYMTRSEVTKAFVESMEFTGICSEYGITRGTYDASIAPIEHFVTRFYTICLERQPDQEGLYGWVNNLKNKHMNGAQIAEQFIFSDELKNRNVSNDKYVEILYNSLLGRPSEESGKKAWVSQLNGGFMTREEMMKAFIESEEFTGICESYGIERGSL